MAEKKTKTKTAVEQAADNVGDTESAAEQAAEQSAAENEALTGGTDSKAPKKKTVKIKLFKDDGRYKDDVFVCVNGKPYAIKRGEWVEVPEAVAKIIEASEKQDGKAASLMQAKQDEFMEESKSKNI